MSPPPRLPQSPQQPPLNPTGKTPGKTRNSGLVIAAFVVALILLIGGLVVAVGYQMRAGQARVAAEHQAQLAQQEAAAQAVAQDFLAALSEADADKALSFAAATPEGNNDLLTREVLVAANSRAALGQVTVGEPRLTATADGAWAEGTVKASYAIGDQPQTVDLPVRRVGADWKVSRVAAPVELGLTGPERVVNGVKVAPGDYNLFPGSYSVTSANPLISLGTSEFVLASPTASVTDWSSEVALSEEGSKQSLEAAKRAVDQCLQSKELAPPQCPFIQWSESGLSIDTSTIRYTLKNDPWANVQFAFNAGTMTASTSVPVEHEIRAEATRDGTRGSLIPQTQQRTAHIVIKVQDGTPQVTFS